MIRLQKKKRKENETGNVILRPPKHLKQNLTESLKKNSNLITINLKGVDICRASVKAL